MLLKSRDMTSRGHSTLVDNQMHMFLRSMDYRPAITTMRTNIYVFCSMSGALLRTKIPMNWYHRHIGGSFDFRAKVQFKSIAPPKTVVDSQRINMLIVWYCVCGEQSICCRWFWNIPYLKLHLLFNCISSFFPTKVALHGCCGPKSM